MTATNTLPHLVLTPELLEAATTCNAWDFDEARKIVRRYEKTGYPDEVLF